MISKSIFKESVVELFNVSQIVSFSNTTASIYHNESLGVQSNLNAPTSTEEIFHTSDFQSDWYSFNPSIRIFAEQVAFVENYLLLDYVPTSWIIEALNEL